MLLARGETEEEGKEVEATLGLVKGSAVDMPKFKTGG